MKLNLTISLSHPENVANIIISNGASGMAFTSMKADEMEDLQSQLESMAFAIRDFRMNNFPESTEAG